MADYLTADQQDEQDLEVRVRLVLRVYRKVKALCPDAANNPLVAAQLTASVVLTEDLTNLGYQMPASPSE